MIAARRLQRSFADGFIAEEVADLWEPWMRQADQVLEDEGLLTLIQQEPTKRVKKSKTRGRPGTPAEVVLRMLVFELKHMRDYSFQELSREVRANLAYREFTRLGGGKTPDDKTMGRLARQLRPEVIRQIHDRVVAMAKEENLVQGRRMRVDTTVVVEQRPLSDRQQSAGRRRAGADAPATSAASDSANQSADFRRRHAC